MRVLQASTFQMAVLLQYNHSPSFTVQQLEESTQIKSASSVVVASTQIPCTLSHFTTDRPVSSQTWSSIGDWVC